jgi:hypothetical protein
MWQLFATVCNYSQLCATVCKVACRNSFGLMPKVETPYIVPKLPKCQNAETAKTAKTAKTVLAFWHSFGITDTNILYEFRHSFDLFNYINLLKLKKKLKKTFLLAVKDLLQYFINILLYYYKFKFIIQ